MIDEILLEIADEPSHRSPAAFNLLLARQSRVKEVMKQQSIPVICITHPINVLYATGARNMTVFSLMNTSRYLLMFAEGPTILFDFWGCSHLAEGLPTLDEIKVATGVSYVAAGTGLKDQASKWADELASYILEYVGEGALIGVDRFHFAALDALRERGFTITDSDQVMAKARSIKMPIEMPFINEAMRRTEQATVELADSLEAGALEIEIWAEFYRGLIAREGEYISTRLLQSGPRTFPYFQEAGPRPIQSGELLCFDTDTIGYHGYAVDYSRTFLCGTDRATDQQKHLYRLAYDQLNHNVDLFQPGTEFEEIADKAWPIPEEHKPYSYYCLAHGLGMSGEYPNIPHKQPGEPYPLKGRLKPGMIVCAESYVGSELSHEGVKLEDQLLITESGPQRMSHFPFDDRLLVKED